MLNNIWKLKQTELKGKYLLFTHERYKKKNKHTQNCKREQHNKLYEK